MEQNTRTTTRTSRRRQRNRRSPGCLGMILLLSALMALFAIFRMLSSAGQTTWTTSLEPNPYSASDFATVGDYVTCTAGTTRMGLDVSEYQERVNWEKVRDAGFDFVFVRIGYRGYTSGVISADDRARENLAGARDAGLDVGVYFYAQAVSTEEAAEEARWCLDFLADEELDLPVVYDWEYVGGSARTAGMDKDTLTACVQTFCDAVETGGYQSMVYFNPHVGRDLLELKQLQQYPWWLAHYRDSLDYPYKIDIWQYTEEGSIPGIKGKVDIDLMFVYD